MYLNKCGVAVICFAIITSGAGAQVTGTGTANQVPKFTGTTTVGNSTITDSSGNVGIGTTTPGALLDVQNGYVLAEGGVISSNRSATGLEFNKLFNATNRFSVAQSGGGSTLNLASLFDGQEAQTYFAADPGVVPSSSNPYVITITGLPNVHIQNGAWVGWTSRYNTVSSSFKIEGWDSYSANNWVTFADINDSTDNNGRGYNEYMLKAPSGSYTSLRFTFRNGESNSYFGLSELFFIHPEATRLYEGLLPSSMWEGSNGNVGIGTSSPVAKLEVNGNVQLDGSGATLKFGDNTIQSTAFSPNAAAVLGAMTQSNGNIGIGITNPGVPLDINGYLHVSGNTNPATDSQGAYFGWNALTGGTGETDFINNEGLGSGGFAFMNTPSSGTPRTTLMFLNGAGNLGIGTTSPGVKLEVNGSLKLDGNGAGVTFADGTFQSTAWNGTLCGGDYAESVDVSGNRNQYEPGDVLIVDPDNYEAVIKSAEPYSTSVAGVYSTKPGALGARSNAPNKLRNQVPMAMVGIVPTKVTTENGPIMPGDLLVTSSTVGYAMKGTNRSQMTGAVIGKAFGGLASGTGVIDVLVTLQ